MPIMSKDVLSLAQSQELWDEIFTPLQSSPKARLYGWVMDFVVVLLMHNVTWDFINRAKFQPRRASSISKHFLASCKWELLVSESNIRECVRNSKIVVSKYILGIWVYSLGLYNITNYSRRESHWETLYCNYP